jgi:hypothetical protein
VNLAIRRTPKPHVTVKYLEPDFSGLFRNGLRGLAPDGSQDRAFHGRELARNAAVGDLALATGLRLQELTYLLPWEVRRLDTTRTRSPFAGVDVISISDDSGESTYRHGFEEIHAQDPGELTAAANGIPVLVATGDYDAAQHLAVSPFGKPIQGWITARPATGVWDDSPWVTAVGGSIPNLSATGKRLGPDRVWNLAPTGSPEGEGAGLSAVYTRPGYQDSVAAITRSTWRSVPDITMDAAGGTSESAPLLAGVLALATQLNHGRNVGPINNALYHVLGATGLKDGIADVVSGNNTLIIDGKVLVRGCRYDCWRQAVYRIRPQMSSRQIRNCGKSSHRAASWLCDAGVASPSPDRGCITVTPCACRNGYRESSASLRRWGTASSHGQRWCWPANLITS